MIIVTRPQEYGESHWLPEGLGQKVIQAPMLKYRPISRTPICTQDYDALIFTSRLGVMAALPRLTSRGLKTFTVGPGTGCELAKAGFQHIVAASGTAQHLLSKLQSIRFKRALYLSGQDITVDLSKEHGLPVDRRVVYQMVPAEGLPSEVLESAARAEPWIVPLYSHRTCQTFEGLIRASGLTRKVAQATAVFISENVSSQSLLPWGRKVVSGSCDADGMADAISKAA